MDHLAPAMCRNLAAARLSADCPSGKVPTALADGNLFSQVSPVGYRSLGQDRTLSFVYNSTAADPRPIVTTETTIPVVSAVPDSISTRLSGGTILSIGGHQYRGTQYLFAKLKASIRLIK